MCMDNKLFFHTVTNRGKRVYDESDVCRIRKENSGHTNKDRITRDNL